MPTLTCDCFSVLCVRELMSMFSSFSVQNVVVQSHVVCDLFLYTHGRSALGSRPLLEQAGTTFCFDYVIVRLFYLHCCCRLLHTISNRMASYCTYTLSGSSAGS